MARKLTPEELERNKADFDIPAGMKPLKPTKEKAPAKKPAAKKTPQPEPQPKHAGGRPKKQEETNVRSFRLPDRTVQRLRVLAALKGVSAADVIVELADRVKVPGLDK